MADLSVRATAASCLGVNPPFSVNSQLYGYIFRDQSGSVGISPRVTSTARRPKPTRAHTVRPISRTIAYFFRT